MQCRVLLPLAVLLWDVLPVALSLSTCKTIDMEQIRKKRIEAIRGQILSKLKLSSPPQAEQVTVTNEVMVLYNSTKELLEKEPPALTTTQEDYYAKEMHRFDILEDNTADRGQDSNSFHKTYKFNIKFNASNKPLLHRAEFRLYRMAKDDATVAQQRVELYEGIPEDRIPTRQWHTTGLLFAVVGELPGVLVTSRDSIYLDNRLLKTKESDEWISFDVTQTVKEWLRMGVIDQQLKISVHCPCETTDKKETFQLRFYEPQRGDMYTLAKRNRKIAHILLMSTPSTRADTHSRRKRDLDTEYCFTTNEEKNCCVRRMYIDFRKDLNWKWIHQPKGYYANFCMGPCPYIWSSDTQYSTVLALYNLHNPGGSASPCCVPQVLEPLTILYYVGRQPKVEQLSNMVVKSCKCS